MSTTEQATRSAGWTTLVNQAVAQFQSFTPASRAVLWAAAAGLTFSIVNALVRWLSLSLDPFETLFLRYVFSVVAMAPLVLRVGWAKFRPHRISAQFWRGAIHLVGLLLWFHALPHIALADTTAIGFTTPIFIMIGAVFVLRESMVWQRWVAALIGFAGVLIVVGPKLSGQVGPYALMSLAAAPVFACSFLLTKVLTRHDRTDVIVVWQAITISVLALPFACWHWTWPSANQWVWFALCGVLGSIGHYCLTSSFKLADLSATQSVKFLDLVWATMIGFLFFGDLVSTTTMIGGVVILAATVAITRWEATERRRAEQPIGDEREL